MFDSCKVVHRMTWLCSQMQDAEIARALAVLFVAHFDPATQDKPRLRQCLSVFFPAYAAASSSHQHHIARAFRRAARGALGVAPIKKAPAPQLMRYMLQVSTASQHRHTVSISICCSHLSCCPQLLMTCTPQGFFLLALFLAAHCHSLPVLEQTSKQILMLKWVSQHA